MTKVLFVCLGNICRSPAAEAVFKKLVEEKGQSDDFFIDSAGTSAYHEGHPADSRMRDHGSRRQLHLDSRSRPFAYDDFHEFDYIITMDESNYADVLSLDQKNQFTHKVMKITDFVQKYDVDEVPDPYYGGHEGFEFVFDLLEDGCAQLLQKISKTNLS